jgi:hypothetical protein
MLVEGIIASFAGNGTYFWQLLYGGLTIFLLIMADRLTKQAC